MREASERRMGQASGARGKRAAHEASEAEGAASKVSSINPSVQFFWTQRSYDVDERSLIYVLCDERRLSATGPLSLVPYFIHAFVPIGGHTA